MIRFSLGLVCASLLCACANLGTYTWAADYNPVDGPGQSYYIRPGDQLRVLVWKQSTLSGTFRVLSSGTITMPLVGDVPMVGLSPAGASQQLEKRLDGLVVDPKVTVSVEQSEEVQISVVGEVSTPGRYPLKPGTTVLDVLAAAGGLTEFARDNRIFVVRPASSRRVRFRYIDLLNNEGETLQFALQGGDILTVD